MKRIIRAAALLIVLVVVLPMGQVLAERPVQVFFDKEAFSEAAAQQLMDLTRRACPETEWEALLEAETGEDLRTLILSDRAPDVAVCAPGEAMPWAREGMLMPLEAFTADWIEMQRQVTDACTWNNHLMMAPLKAKHRQMAVNRLLLERVHLGELAARRDRPVWYPSELSQLLEEFELLGTPAVEIWPCEPGSCAGMEALIQAIFGGSLLSEDGKTAQVDNPSVVSALNWLKECMENGMIGRAKSREEALDHFLKGKTALFLDWTQDEERENKQAVKRGGMELVVLPYPSVCGLPIRSFELTGVCVFSGEKRVMGAELVKLWTGDPQAQQLLGDRLIWRDDTVWLPMMNAGGTGAAVRSLFCQAVEDVLAGKVDAQEAVSVMAAALRAMERK